MINVLSSWKLPMARNVVQAKGVDGQISLFISRTFKLKVQSLAQLLPLANLTKLNFGVSPLPKKVYVHIAAVLSLEVKPLNVQTGPQNAA